MINIMKRRIIQNKFRIEEVNPISIPDTVDLERTPPNSVVKAYSGRFDRFDYKTLFFDTFVMNNGRSIRLSGPPLANLKDYIDNSVFYIDGLNVNNRVRLKDITRKQDSMIKCNGGQQVKLDCPHFSVEATISNCELDTFSKMNTLLTINKNNSLSWVVDWANFYSRAHGINAVLLYDTGSTAYTSNELLSALRSVAGIQAAVVVRWPFRHGPFRERPGVDASANYSQVAMLTHAKEKYLSRARSVIHCDIDELIYSFDGTSVCDAAMESPIGVVSVGGTWIESVTAASQPYRHLDFRHAHVNRSDCFPKWCVAPSKLPPENNWQVHAIWGLEGIESSPRFRLAHFRGINTNWREKRAVYTPPTAKHEIFEDIERYIAPHWAESSPYQLPPQQLEGMGMAIAQDEMNAPPKAEPAEIKPSLDSGGLEALTEHLLKCETYLEYGCGGSTVLAAKSGVKRIIAVDTAETWLDTVKNHTKEFEADITLKHCDLGPVKAWGYPVDKQKLREFHRYAILPWDEARASGFTPQVVFIDGRFRVACFLYSLMAAEPGTKILFDDYMNRPPYHEVEKFCPRAQARGRMGVFVVDKKPPLIELAEAFAKYSIIEF